MSRLLGVLARWECHVLVFFVFVALYLWPLLTSVGSGRLDFAFTYYFSVFAFHVAVLVLVAISHRSSASDHGSSNDED